MIEIGAVATESSNLTLGRVNPVEPSGRKNDAADVASMDMSFEDVIDLINPLEHIPVLSSLYRGISGETISPVSRIAGDALYGGVFGVASAALSALGAIGDEIITANNGGQSVSSTVVAALFGEEGAETVKVAATSAKPDGENAPAPEAAPALPVEAVSPMAVAAAPAANKPSPTSKLPFGGVMDSALLASAQQNQALALAMAGQRNALQAQRSVHNSRFEVSQAEEAGSPPPSLQPEGSRANTPVQPETQAALQALLQDLRSMKAINEYKNAAEATSASGGTVNILN
jgi:hypothetical protein